MKDPRTKFFFWLGVLVLPAFWSWFTLGRRFSDKERLVAFAWLGITLGLLAADWHAVQEFGSLVAYGYTIVVGLLTMGLWLWLVFRIGYRPTFIECLGLFFVFGGMPLRCLLSSLDQSAGQPFYWAWLIAPLVAAVLHLLVDPTKTLFQKWRWLPPA